MEMADFEGMPLSEQYEKVVTTWHAFSDTVGRYFENEAEPQVVADSLAAHLTSLPAFIESYLADGNERDQEALTAINATLLHLHQETIEHCIEAYNLDKSSFSFIDDEQCEHFVEAFIENIQEIEEQSDALVDIPGSIYQGLRDVLLTNTTTLLNLVDYEYEVEETTEKVSLKNHAIDVGKTALGVFVGMSAYALAKHLSRQRPR